jgi:hypothetical protein
VQPLAVIEGLEVVGDDESGAGPVREGLLGISASVDATFAVTATIRM